MKKSRILICLIIVLNIIILGIIIVKINKPKVPEDTEIVPITTEEDRKIYPENSYQLTRLYSGVTEMDKFYLKLYKCVHYLNRIGNSLEDVVKSGSQDYYKKNKDTIKLNTGIDNSDDFQNFVEYARKYKNGGEYKNIELLPDTFVKTKDYDTINLNINLNNGDKLEFKVYMGNVKDTKGNVKILPLEKK